MEKTNTIKPEAMAEAVRERYAANKTAPDAIAGLPTTKEPKQPPTIAGLPKAPEIVNNN